MIVKFIYTKKKKFTFLSFRISAKFPRNLFNSERGGIPATCICHLASGIRNWKRSDVLDAKYNIDVHDIPHRSNKLSFFSQTRS